MKRGLLAQVTALRIGKGDAVLVHSSAGAVEMVEGGATGLIRAIASAVGREGSVMVPASDSIAPAVRARRGSRFSDHPAFSFTAVGRNADFLTRHVPFHYPLGSESPLARLHQLDGGVLLIGADQSSNLALHLAEIWADMPYTRRLRLVHLGDDEWKEMTGDPGCTAGFHKIDRILRQARILKEGKIGDIPAQFMRIRPLTSMAGEMLRGNPEALLCDDPACRSCGLARKMVRAVSAI